MPLLIFLAKAFLVLIHFFVGYPNSSNICPGVARPLAVGAGKRLIF